MKKSLILPFIFSAFASYSKTTVITFPTLYPHFGMGEASSLPGGANPVRLIAATKNSFDGNQYIPFDSTIYHYSNGRGGILDQDYQDYYANFDESIVYAYDAATGIYTDEIRYTQTFLPLNKIDTRIRENYINGNWHNSLKYDYIYDVHYDKLVRTDINLWYNTWVTTMGYQIEYDVDNNIATIKFPSNITYLLYDQQHNITERKEYTYNSATGWSFTDKYDFYYNANSQMTSYIQYRYLNGVWEEYQKVEFTFAGNNVANAKQYSWTNESWTLFQQNNYTYDGQNNKLSDETQVWDSVTNSLKNLRKENWVYNMERQPTAYYSETWNETNNNWTTVKGDFYNHYYYEYYNTTAVKDPIAAADYFSVYPVPASVSVSLVLKKQTYDKTNGFIYDMTGHVVRNFTIENTEKTISVSDLPDGNYLIGLTGQNKKLAQPFVVKH